MTMLQHINILFCLQVGFDSAFARLAFRLKGPFVHLHGNEAFIAGIREYNSDISDSLPHDIIDYDFIIADLSDSACIEIIRKFSKNHTVVIPAEYFIGPDSRYLEMLMTENSSGLSTENRDTVDCLKKALHTVSLIQMEATLRLAQETPDLDDLTSAAKLLFKM